MWVLSFPHLPIYSRQYQASKGLAAEYGKDGIRVNALCPLLSATPLFENFVGVPATEENVKKFLFNVPLGKIVGPQIRVSNSNEGCSGRLTDPDDVANMCLYLGSDEGKFITGVNLEIDGGRAVGA